MDKKFKGTVSSQLEQTLNRAWNWWSEFKMNTVTENYWLIYAAAMVIRPYHLGFIFSH